MIDPDLLKKLEELGIKTGEAQWAEMKPVNADDLPTALSHRETLEKLKGILQIELHEHELRLAEAREQYERLKNGGGS